MLLRYLLQIARSCTLFSSKFSHNLFEALIEVVQISECRDNFIMLPVHFCYARRQLFHFLLVKIIRKELILLLDKLLAGLPAYVEPA